MASHNHSAVNEGGELGSPHKKARIEGNPADTTMHDIIDNVTPHDPLHANSCNLAPQSEAMSVISVPPESSVEKAPQAESEAVYDQNGKEVACGITEYTDFLVNEILPSGQVVHLDQTRAPKRGKKSGKQPTFSQAKVPTRSEARSNESGRAEYDDTPSSKVEPDVSSISFPPTVVAAKPSLANDVSVIAKVESQGTESKYGNELASIPSGVSELGTQTDGANESMPQDLHPPSNPPVPMSMQDLDLPAPEAKEPAPHMRARPSSPPIPLSTRDLDDAQATEKPSRKKETVRLHRTSQGWIEINEQMEKDLKDAQSTEAAVATEKSVTEPMSVEEGVEDRFKEEKSNKPAREITQASWQAYARETAADAEATIGFQLKSQDLTALLSYFSPATVKEIVDLCDQSIKSPHRKAKDHGTVITPAIDRQTRSKIHQDIRRIFDSRLETATNDDGAMVITVMPGYPNFRGGAPVEDSYSTNQHSDRHYGRNDRGRGGKGDNRREGDGRANKRTQWAELGGDYLHFSLYKENKDTMESISWLTKMLDMKPSAFQFAGTKDRRGVTVQRVSVYRVFADRMFEVGRTLRGAKVGNFEYRPHPLQLGQLTGNEFVITLRDCDFHVPMPMDSETMTDTARAVVGEAITNLASHGFINYYGLQRFGTFATSTDEVGVKMLQGDFEGAVNSILHFNPASLAAAQDPMANVSDKISKDDQARAYAINSFQTTGNAHSPLQDLPRKFSAESSIIRHLGRPNSHRDFLGALQAVSRNMRLMYVHAYQSLVWNMAASERWRRFGATVVEGDLVVISEHRDKDEHQPNHESIDADGEAIFRPNEDDRAADREDMFTRARALLAEEAQSGVYNIFDVVLPSPGFDIIYPANEMKKFYENFMASERGGGLNPHDMRRQWKDISLSGSYRKLLAKPGKAISFDIKIYQDDGEQFVETDLDRLDKAKKERMNAQHNRSAPLHDDPAQAQASGTKSNIDAKELESEPEPKPKVPSSTDSEPGGVKLSGGPYHGYKVAVILQLQLGSSQYATMALRELMKHGGAKAYKPDFGGGR